ncbi:innexin inx2-like [Portunus trituberculatus]|uniref:innexin inx2-like n=1 Tax=Portunus trituberculatus TaxID=210409 RepID=UPI001E1CFD56|nr:innexin inx2-like [Portunus trituberculatus]
MLMKALAEVKVKVEVKPGVDNLVFRLHYRYTYIVFLTSALLATLYDAIGDQIDCLTDVDSDSFNDVVNSYCFIMGTFTVDRLHGRQVGQEVPHPGVGPPEMKDSITYHTYYQWVPFVLFVQAVMFYMPHWLWKITEGGLFKHIIQDLSIRDYLGGNLDIYFNKDKRFKALAKYLKRTMNSHHSWAYKFFLCELLNLGVVVATLFFTDWFLGGEFLTYGTSVFAVAGQDPENRTDPMSYVFPRMAKCTFRSFGPSGTIQVRDMMCLIATNIINEKIYLFLWVWLVLLTTLTSLWMLYRLLTILLPPLRNQLLKLRVDRSVRGLLKDVLRGASLSDWLLLYSLGKNMERSVFTEFILFLHSEMTSLPSVPKDPEEELKQQLFREDFILPNIPKERETPKKVREYAY